MIDVNVSSMNVEEIDGYLVTSMSRMKPMPAIISYPQLIIFILEKNSESLLPKLEAGGRYSMPVLDENGKETSVEEQGLEYGKAYHFGISAFKNITLTNGEVIRVQGREARTAEPVLLRRPDSPAVAIENVTKWQTLIRSMQVSDTETNEISVDTFAQKNV